MPKPFPDATGLALTPARLKILIPLAFLLWGLAWATIHFRGPAGAFVGLRGIVLYALTIPATIGLNTLHLKLARLPRREIVDAVAVTLAVATTIDSVLIAFFPEAYGVDDATLRHGAAWLLWAGAVACGLAFVTRYRALREERATEM